MKKLIIMIMLMFSSFCLACENTPFSLTTFNSVNTYNIGTGHEFNITPVGSTEVYPQMTDVYRQRKVREHPYDPNPDPIGDCPALYIIILTLGYLCYKLKPWRLIL